MSQFRLLISTDKANFSLKHGERGGERERETETERERERQRERESIPDDGDETEEEVDIGDVGG